MSTGRWRLQACVAVGLLAASGLIAVGAPPPVQTPVGQWETGAVAVGIAMEPDGSRVYYTASDAAGNRVVARDLPSGNVAWSFSNGAKYRYLCLDEGNARVIALAESDSPGLIALSKSTGTQLWTASIEGFALDCTHAGSPRVVVGDGSNRVQFVDGTNGVVKWTYAQSNGLIKDVAMDWDGDAAVAITASVLYYFHSSGTLAYSINAGNSWAEVVGADPSKKFLAGHSNGQVWYLDDDFQESWNIGQNVMAVAAAGNNDLFMLAAGRNGNIYRIYNDNVIEMRVSVGETPQSAVMSADGGRAFVVTQEGGLFYLDLAGGTAVWRASVVASEASVRANDVVRAAVVGGRAVYYFTDLVTACTLTGGQKFGQWYHQPPTIALSPSGSNPPFTTTYRVNGGSWNPYVEPFTAPIGANTIVEFYSTDGGGAAEGTKSCPPINVDPEPPEGYIDQPQEGATIVMGLPPQGNPATGPVGIYGTPVEVKIRAHDNISGIQVWFLKDLPSDTQICSGTAEQATCLWNPTAAGDHTLRLSVFDKAFHARFVNRNVEVVELT